MLPLDSRSQFTQLIYKLNDIYKLNEKRQGYIDRMLHSKADTLKRV